MQGLYDVPVTIGHQILSMKPITRQRILPMSEPESDSKAYYRRTTVTPPLIIRVRRIALSHCPEQFSVNAKNL